MIEVFGFGKALLSPEFVEKVNPEALAAKLIEVEKEYDVKFEKTESSFNIIGYWKAIQDAHNSLLQLTINLKPCRDDNLRTEPASDIDVLSDNSRKSAECRERAPSTSSETRCLPAKHPETKKFVRLKGKPRRSRQTDKNNPNTVPDPVTLVQFQDQSFPDECFINLEQVLDEFEKDQASKSVKREDLKKIFEKDIDKMGKSLNKPNLFALSNIADSRHNLNNLNNTNKIEASQTDVPGALTKIQNLNNTDNETVTGQTSTKNDLQTDPCQVHNNFNTDKGTSQDVQVLQSGTKTIGHVPLLELKRLKQDEDLHTASEIHDGSEGLKEIKACSDTTHDPNMTQMITDSCCKNVVDEEMELKESTRIESLKNKNNGRQLRSKQKPSTILPTEKGLSKAKKDKGQQNDDNVLTKKTTKKVSKKTSKQKTTTKTNANTPKKVKAITDDQKQVYRIKDEEDREGTTVAVKIKEEEIDTKSKSESHQCSLCEYETSKRKRLNDHMGRVHGILPSNGSGSKEQDQHKCEECQKVFVFEKDLKRHKRIVHNEARFVCNICEKVYKAKYVYDKHMEKHAEGYVQHMFKCQLCPREFTTKFALGCHTKSEHLGVKKMYICPTCGKSFKQLRSYKQHANVHAGIRPYVCEVCGMSFSYDKSLKEHRYMHDDVRRFSCTLCDKSFRQRTCLLIHMKVHKNSKDHICSSCGKAFTQRQSLIRHERIHSGYKPYTCKLCNKSFSDYAVIRKHVLLRHKETKINWKMFVVSEERKPSDHYIKGGPGYGKRERCEMIQTNTNSKQSTSQTSTGQHQFLTNHTQANYTTEPFNVTNQSVHRDKVFKIDIEGPRVTEPFNVTNQAVLRDRMIKTDIDSPTTSVQTSDRVENQQTVLYDRTHSNLHHSQYVKDYSEHIVGVIAKPRNSSFNQAGVTRFCNNTDTMPGYMTASSTQQYVNTLHNSTNPKYMLMNSNQIQSHITTSTSNAPQLVAFEYNTDNYFTNDKNLDMSGVTFVDTDFIV